MLRLFAAIPLPEAWRVPLEKLRSEIPDARWVSPFKYHVTLQFIGAAVSEDCLPEIASGLETVTAPPFELRLKGVTRFGSAKRPGVLVAKVSENEALAQLHATMAAALRNSGLALEKRAFQPHITLAYLGRRSTEEAAQAFLERYAAFEAEAAQVREFVLYQSLEQAYVPLKVYPLKE